jgi:hypothetical protein
MGTLSPGTTVIEAVKANPRRVAVIFTNEGSSDEVVRVDEDREDTSTSGNIIYNRESIKFKGRIAKNRLWIVSDTASTTVGVTEVF